jgi:Ca-activated chloride channel homolog
MCSNKKQLYSLIALALFISYIRAQDKKPKVPSFRVDVASVFLNIAVADPLDRYVTGLEKADFKVYEDNIEQTISHFSRQFVPVSLGYIFDISGSMEFSSNIGREKNWFRQLLRFKDADPADECFLITFNNNINLAQDFEYESELLLNDIFAKKTGGWTALYDAVYMGINKVKEGKNERKALVMISDGEENSSVYKWSQIRDLARESGVPIYAIGLSGPENNSVLKQIADLTGGRVFFHPSSVVFSTGYLSHTIQLIHTELRNQYLIGYAPTNDTPDGKWRKIKVKLVAPPGFPKLSIRTKDGYYAAKY